MKLCFELDPEKRATCDILLNHEYFDKKFKQDLEQELFGISGNSTFEGKSSYRRSISNDPSSPEPSLTSKYTSRDITPHRIGQKSIGTIRFNPEDLIPQTKTPDLREELHIGPPPNFLPNLKLKRDEESAHNSSFYGLKKKSSDIKIPLIKQLKHSTDISYMKNQQYMIKNLDLSQNIIEKSHNLSTIYEMRDYSSGNQTIRSGNPSKTHIKQRVQADHSYFQPIPTPVPTKMKYQTTFPKKTKITFLKTGSQNQALSKLLKQ
ncbi:unnamed protein product [Blepharisma stoltei]|uniref:Serine/threonine protein kinase n=1 Tax=Blepharisma stoltei TaxID=1481888 RepID=A0AAU9JKK3_9CILI|nr:unnamed protein product [Blepharisma stoltei]